MEVAKRPIYSKNYGRKKFCSAGPGPVYLFLTDEMFENWKMSLSTPIPRNLNDHFWKETNLRREND